MLTEMQEFILDDQAYDGVKCFNTRHSYEIHDSFFNVKRSLEYMESPSDTYILLLAYTYMIWQYDNWMHDSEGTMHDMVKGLARLWKRTLKMSDEEVGIGSKYTTRPGLRAFLKKFKKDVEGGYSG